jgi:hypothetical protein
LSEINKIIEENKTIHFIFHNKFAWSVYIIFILSMILDWIKLPYFSELRVFIFFLGLAYFLIRQIAPYSSFDTATQERINKFSSWFINGLAGVFFFGVIATYIRNIMF